MTRFRDNQPTSRYRGGLTSPKRSLSNGMRRFNLTHILVITAAICALATPAVAQEAVRTAGDATRFRVIQRIPPAKHVAIEELAWPYPDSVRHAVENDDWPRAWAELKTIPPDHDERFAFLWGWVALRGEAFDEAQKAFAELAARDGLFVDYENLYAAEAAFRAGRYEDAVTHAARVTNKTVPHRSAALILARALVEKGDAEKGIRALRAFVDAFGDHDDVATARTELARALHGQKRDVEAAQLLVRVRTEKPLWSGLDDEFDELQKAVFAGLTKKERAAVEHRDAHDWLTEYRARFRAHDSEDVIAGLSNRVLKWKKKSSERCEGLFLVGNSYTKLRKHADSTTWYERLVSECKGDKHYIRALYKGGKGYWNAGKKDDAYRFFERMWSEFPRHSYADDGMYFGSRILSEQDKDAEARKLLLRQVRTYPDGDMASDAHWLFVRENFHNKEYDKVVAYVDALTDPGEQDLYSRGRLAYFRARALQLLGRDADARTAYGAVVRDNPMGYYALFALNRLAQMIDAKGDDICAVAEGALCNAIQTTAGQPISVDPELANNAAFRRGKAFLQVSLDGFAQLEFQRLRGKVGDDAEKLWTLAALLDAAGAYPYSHNIARRDIPEWETFYPDRERAQRWQVGYPAPFESEVRDWAKKRELPAELVWGIMREESGFNPRIRSWAGAIGLMQVMPGTARVAARKDGYDDFSTSDLTNPDAALRIGTAYLDDLADRAKDHPVLMIAGYNGGWGNVSKWLADPDSRDLDLWVEDIPYGQTRNYTKRVLRSMWVYSWLYGDKRVPRFDLTVPKS